MKKVLFLTLFLLAGLFLSQYLPQFIEHKHFYHHIISVGTMISLSFIIIHVGYEFILRRSRLKQYSKDYLVAFTSATFPWIFISYFQCRRMALPKVV